MASSRNRSKQNATSIGMDEANLDAINESMAEILSSKVGQLKSLAIDLDSESRDHMPLLDGLDDGFDSGLGRLTTTFNRLRLMGRGNWTSGRRFVVIISGVTLGMLFVVYLLMRNA